MKPTTYDGSSSIESYLQQYEAVCTLNDWDDEEAALNLFASVKGAALDTLAEVPSRTRASYTTLRSALLKRFDKLSNKNRSLGALRERKRKRTESFEELAQDIRRLVRKAYPNNPDDGVAVSHFLDACQDPEMDWQIKWRLPDTLEEVVAMASDYEASRMGRTEQIKALHTHPEILAVVEPSPSCRKCGGTGHIFKNCPEVQCHNCKQYGHISPNCPQPKSFQSRKNDKNQGNEKDLRHGAKSQDQKNKGPAK